MEHTQSLRGGDGLMDQICAFTAMH